MKAVAVVTQSNLSYVCIKNLHLMRWPHSNTNRLVIFLSLCQFIRFYQDCIRKKGRNTTDRSKFHYRLYKNLFNIYIQYMYGVIYIFIVFYFILGTIDLFL